MKSIYILAAIILVFQVSVLTADDNTVDRHSETSLRLQAMNLILDPDVSFNTEMAFELMDKLCGQIENGMQGIVSGALNVDTGEFKTWAEYTASEGQNPNKAFYFATGPWQTFLGECMLRPQSTWWEHGPKSFGYWGGNASGHRGNRLSPINVRFAGFTTKTSMPSWRAKCENQNVDAMASLFRTMPGIPGDLISVWDGLERRYEETIPMVRRILLDSGQRGRVVATTTLRVVHAVQVFRVEEWWWYSNDQDGGFATTWRRLGLAWKHVYSEFAFVEARGLSQQFPKDRTHVPGPRPNVDPCVNLDNMEVARAWGREPEDAELVVPAISRTEL